MRVRRMNMLLWSMLTAPVKPVLSWMFLMEWGRLADPKEKPL